MVIKDNWDEEFNKWRKKKKLKKSVESNKKYLTELKAELNTGIDKVEKEFKEIEHKVEEEVEAHPALTKTLIFLAFAIPVAILLYALYINYLPFGWEQTYELTIDQEGIISPISKDIYITNSQGRRLLSLPDGVDGQINVVIEPNVVLKDATVNIEIQGDDVSLGTPMNLNLSDYQWDYNWDFNEGIPSDLVGNAEYSTDKGCVCFDAVNEETLYLPNSSDMFEDGPMSVYVKWKPSEVSRVLGSFQQLVGHYNWEIYQGEDNIRFQVGRMNDADGPFYSVTYLITSDFYDNEHELLAIYSPEENGYVELWVDGNFAQRVLISNDTIYKDYTSDRDLNLGRSTHNYNTYPYFDGCIYNAKITNEAIKEEKKTEIITNQNSPITLPLVGTGNLNSIIIQVTK